MDDESLESLFAELERFGEVNDKAISERPRRMLNITRDTVQLFAYKDNGPPIFTGNPAAWKPVFEELLHGLGLYRLDGEALGYRAADSERCRASVGEQLAAFRMRES